MSELFLKATKQKLRFQTNRGLVTTEDLWDLSLDDLDSLARSLNKEIKEKGEESFIKTTKVDPKIKLSFEVAKSVIETKLADADKAQKAAATKEKNQKILALIARKKDAELEGLSLEELEEMVDS